MILLVIIAQARIIDQYSRRSSFMYLKGVVMNVLSTFLLHLTLVLSTTGANIDHYLGREPRRHCNTQILA